MNTFIRFAGGLLSRLGESMSIAVLSLTLLFAFFPLNQSAAQDAPAPAAPQDAQDAATPPQAPPYTQQTAEQLQQLVAPIALYPDSLVAQILAASAFPEQIVEADRWAQANPNLKGVDLGHAVDQQPWDPSVKALAAFPSVLGNMDKNLSWTSSLGDAYYNQQPDVMDAVQVMRQRAQTAGNLATTPQQTVATQDSNISIAPTDPDEVYVPAYNPWSVYGGPVVAWPGWYPYPGISFGGPYLSWGGGFGIGWFGGFGWGWGHWGFNWGGRYAMYGGGRYYSGSRTFYNRSSYARAAGARGGFNGARGGVGGARGGVYNRPGATARPFDGNRQAARGYAAPRGQSGVRSGAYSGYNHGGQAKSYSSRGRVSAGAGAAHAGGGGHAGGGHR